MYIFAVNQTGQCNAGKIMLNMTGQANSPTSKSRIGYKPAGQTGGRYVGQGGRDLAGLRMPTMVARDMNRWRRRLGRRNGGKEGSTKGWVMAAGIPRISFGGLGELGKVAWMWDEGTDGTFVWSVERFADGEEIHIEV
ncbi:MAG: hypothetical protein EOP49_05840 [Sphingobacteriales bacterium]|nr:MAG: hypothetical protein EOP49_05840 [Sphingobacteriales bacterium]